MGALGGIFSGIGAMEQGQSTAAADDLLAQGDFKAAADYNTAQIIAAQNADITKISTAIQQQQLNMKIYQTESTEVAATGAANVSGGDSGYLMRMSMQQGSLARSITATQGSIQENAYTEQSLAYQAMRDQAQAAGEAAIVQGEGAKQAGQMAMIGSIVGALGGMI